MKQIILELTMGTDKPLTLISTNFSVYPDLRDLTNCRVLDGIHNNGGWSVKETYEQVTEMISAQLHGEE